MNQRSGGVLLPMFSLPDAPWMGGLGAGAERFASFLADSGCRWWQMLPVTPIDPFHSPYSSCSAFAGETLFIDLDELYRDGLLDRADCVAVKEAGQNAPPDTVDYQRARQVRFPLWQKAFERYRRGEGGERYRDSAERFFSLNDDWLDDFALFRVLANRFGTDAWSQWPTEFRRRNVSALAFVRRESAEKLAFVQFLQLVFDTQWSAFKSRCRRQNVRLLGDVPIYVGAAGAETWSRPDLFFMSADGVMERVSGVPADAFNPNGQRWNSPLYRWDRLEQEHFDWWLRRIGKTLERFDAIRLDHFIGFYNFYSYPTDEAARAKYRTESDAAAAGLLPVTSIDAQGGFWAKGPAEKLLDTLFARFAPSAFIAEDLGVMTKGVHDLRDRYALPGMEVLQFSFDGRRDFAPDPTAAWPTRSVACTGTHDTHTVRGWLESLLSPEKAGNVDYSFVARTLWEHLPDEEHFVGHYNRSRDRLTVLPDDLARLTRGAIRGVLDSASSLALVPMPDWLGLDSSARMNFPGKSENNWRWRLTGERLDAELSEKIRRQMEESGRKNVS